MLRVRQRVLVRWGLLLPVVLLACACSDSDQDRPAVGAAPEVTGNASEPEPRTAWTGSKIYDEVCDRCHKMGVDGAPELGDKRAWAKRIGKGEAVLLEHVKEGFGEMPPRGKCEFCSDDQLQSAMRYMIGKSR